MGNRILFHADDYGLSVGQSRRILSCSDLCGGHGALDSVSVMANLDSFDECADLIAPFVDVMAVGVHLNIVEGPSLSDPRRIPLLVGDDGRFRRSFTDILRMGCGRLKEQLTEQIAIEYGAQIGRVVTRFPQLGSHLRLDSHQHFHLIPAAFKAVARAVEGCGCQMEYLRIPVEPRRMNRLCGGLLQPIRPVNRLKCLVLDRLWQEDRSAFPDYAQRSALFAGVSYSGSMDDGLVRKMLPAYLDLSRERGMDVEFLFHPGKLEDASECPDPTLKGFVDFHLSENRELEARALESLADVMR